MDPYEYFNEHGAKVLCETYSFYSPIPSTTTTTHDLYCSSYIPLELEYWDDGQSEDETEIEISLRPNNSALAESTSIFETSMTSRGSFISYEGTLCLVSRP